MIRKQALRALARLLFFEDRVCFLLGGTTWIGAHVDLAYSKGYAAGKAEAQAELEQLRATLKSGVQA